MGMSREAAAAGEKGKALELACAFDQEKAYAGLGMSKEALADEYAAPYSELGMRKLWRIITGP